MKQWLQTRLSHSALSQRFVPVAHSVKLVFQYALGAMIFFSVLMYMLSLGCSWLCSDFDLLRFIGRVLLVSAGVELAYMLFTDGPDEAVDPLLLGLSATSLLIIARLKDVETDEYVELLFGSIGVFVLVLGICLLIYIRGQLRQDLRRD